MDWDDEDLPHMAHEKYIAAAPEAHLREPFEHVSMSDLELRHWDKAQFEASVNEAARRAEHRDYLIPARPTGTGSLFLPPGGQAATQDQAPKDELDTDDILRSQSGGSHAQSGKRRSSLAQ